MLATSPVHGALVLSVAGERPAVARRAAEPDQMDESTFRSLYERTARRLRAYLRSAVGETALVDDLLQEAYYRLLRSGFHGNDEQHRVNYLYRIATNLVRDHYRRRRPEVEISPEQCASDGPAAEVDRRSDLRRVLAGLKLRDRQMLWLAYAEGMSHQEVARALGLQPASVRSMLFRARQRMAGLLRASGLSPEGGVGS